MNIRTLIRATGVLLAITSYQVVAQQYAVPALQPSNTDGESWAQQALNRGVSYTENEKRSVAIANKIKNKKLDAYEADDGSVTYLYGQAMAVVVCSPMKLCNISLEKGEIVNDVHIGDSARWKISPSVSGEPPNQIVHAVVKPIEVGIETSLMITTDRRVYQMTLKSSNDEYMPSVKFQYPSTDKGAWDSLIKDQGDALLEASLKAQADAEAIAAENAQFTGTPRLGVSVDDLHFKYRVTGDDYSWRPLRVFDDGIRTIIQLPESAMTGDIPVLLASNDTDDIVNYRVKDNRYIVDGVTPQLILIKGVGRKQERLTINRKN